ncbi:MAG: PorT family protein [Thermoflexibacter sp.]|jgi:hypothetical protein|nr:PorT family protein [Thermoflexibacter sp.]
MKMHFLFTLTFFIFSHVLFAQTEKGNFLVGGTAHYTINRYENGLGSNRLLNISPNVGYFFADKWLFGANLPMIYQLTERSTFSQKANIFSFSAGVFLRRYFKLSNRMQWFGQTEYNRGWYKNNFNEVFGGNTIPPNINSWNVGAGIGATYFFNQSIGLEGLFKYNYRSQGGIFNTFPQYALNFNLGLQIYLGRKKASEEENEATFIAPTQKGNWTLGGSGFSNFSSNSNRIFLQPKFGYFLANNFLVGGGIGLNFTWGQNEFQMADNQKDTFANVFARYYFLPTRFKLFAETGFDYGKSWEQYNNAVDGSFRALNFSAGGTYFISRNVGIEASINYQRAFKQRNFLANNPLDFRIGLQIYMNRK